MQNPDGFLADFGINAAPQTTVIDVSCRRETAAGSNNIRIVVAVMGVSSVLGLLAGQRLQFDI